MTNELPEPQLAKYIRSIPDFPKRGILFRNVTPLLANPAAFRAAVAAMADPFRGAAVEMVVGAEARGFIFAAAVALELGAGLAPIRKPGKLPYQVEAVAYDLEYGADILEIHTDAIARRRECWSWTTSWPPAARSRPAAGWWRSSAAKSSAARS